MPRGRPRTFETEQALDAALDLFWRRGYEGASMAALSEAMGINLPSLYAAFGSKADLFAAVVDRYVRKPASYLHRAIAQPTARAVAEHALHGAIDMAAKPQNADGCLLVHGALATSPAGEPVRAELNRKRAAAETAVRQRLERAHAEGDLPADTDPAQLAQFLMTVIWGMSVQAAGGATREQLRQVADAAMRAWPT